MGSYFVPPPAGAGVWVEFEQGDAERPIWVGCFWGPGQIPPLAQASATAAPGKAVITLETNAAGLSICDTAIPPGGSVNIHAGAAVIALGLDGLTITAPQVTINTPLFTVNNGALKVLGP
jgi:uncharacterized protein involved in type VI secretion and phage assembly